MLALGVSVPLLGRYLAQVFGGGLAPGDRVFGPVERLLYRLTGVDPDREQRWPTYATSLLAFSAVSVLALYALQRFQGSLPFNPTGVDGVPPALAFNTAVSFVTNTNWQNYAAENTMSHLTQMVGLAVQNFVSAAVGLAVAVALIRGLVRRRSDTIGNFWVDLVRGTVRVLLPIAFVAALVLVSQGVVQNLGGFDTVTTVEGAAQVIPGGPAASQEAIKELGTNGGGFLNANSAHPFGNPNGLHQPPRDLPAAAHPLLAGRHLRSDGRGQAPGHGRPRRHARPLAGQRRDRHGLRGGRQPRAGRREA